MALDICVEMLAYSEIKQRILDWRLLPGTRLLHRALARELGTSATPVVLALRMLERDGLVVSTPGLGSCVRVWSRDDLVDLYRMRAMVDGSAARLCAERASNGQLAAISEANAAFELAADSRDPVMRSMADAEFHMAIIRAAGCSDLERMADHVSIARQNVIGFHSESGAPVFTDQSVNGDHSAIVEALMCQESDAAEREARAHVEALLESNLGSFGSHSGLAGPVRYSS